jgi:hypothetical protein
MEKHLNQRQLINHSLLHALLVTAYVLVVAALLQNSEKMFGKINSMLGVAAFLMLLVLSATIVGILIFGRPVLLYLDNQKKEALKMFFYTGGWLLLLTFVVFMAIFLIY